MIIANPIYDAVFKYLLADNRIAKLLISTIIEEDIKELEFRPEEIISTTEDTDRKDQVIENKDKKLKDQESFATFKFFQKSEDSLHLPLFILS